MFYASRMAMCRALIPKLAYDNNSLVFWTTCGPATTFDPKITGVAGTWFFDDGTTLDAASGVEISKTFADDGLHRAVFRPASGGLAAITAIDCNTDRLVSVENVLKTLCITLHLYANSGMRFRLADVPKTCTNVGMRDCGVGVTGTILDISQCTVLYMGGIGLSGTLSEINSSATVVWIYSCSAIAAGSIAHLVAIRDLRIYNMGWDEESVDLVIDSIYQAVVADANHFTYASPALQIGGSGGTANAAPSGVYQEATPPTTGLEKVYYLCHLAAHAWTITWNGGSGP